MRLPRDSSATNVARIKASLIPVLNEKMDSVLSGGDEIQAAAQNLFGLRPLFGGGRSHDQQLDDEATKPEEWNLITNNIREFVQKSKQMNMWPVEIEQAWLDNSTHALEEFADATKPKIEQLFQRTLQENFAAAIKTQASRYRTAAKNRLLNRGK